MSAVVADTHTVIWYLLNRENLSINATLALEQATAAGDPINVASISVVEVIYLVEGRRLPEVALERLTRALSEVGSEGVRIRRIALDVWQRRRLAGHKEHSSGKLP